MKRCACGRLPDETGWPESMEPGLVVYKMDGTHRHSHCEITQTVSESRPDQDTLLAQVEQVRQALQWYPKASANEHPPTKAWNDAMDQVYAAFLGLPNTNPFPLPDEMTGTPHDD